MSDDFRVEDLTTLVLALRDRTFGKETMWDLGAFVAHRNERNHGKSLTTKSTRDFFTFLKGGYLQNPIDLADLPPRFAVTLAAAFRRIDNERLKQDTGLKRAVAERLLTIITKKSNPIIRGDLTSLVHRKMKLR
jgi:hypothetical protein